MAALQRRMPDLAPRSGCQEELERGGHRRMSLAWEIWGALAILTPLVAFGLMVFKPSLGQVRATRVPHGYSCILAY